MRIILLILPILLALNLPAQQILENRTFKSSIKTVLLYNAKSEQSFPLIQLGSSEQLIFAFDDLEQTGSGYYYSIEHCTADWTVSPISRLDYLDGFATDRITDYRLSFNTIRQYTHYEVRFPNAQIRPKIAGNYILKVFEEGKPRIPVITSRFYVSSNSVNIGVEVTGSNIVALRNTNQKVNFTVFHNFSIGNPANELRAFVMQNFDVLAARSNKQPTFVRPGALVYNDLEGNDFPAGSEFRKFDIRNLRFKGTSVRDILRDSLNSVALYPDETTAGMRYSAQSDENGNFFVINQTGRDSRIDADYARVYFSLRAEAPGTAGKAYIVGRFNHYTRSAENLLVYDPSKKTFNGSLLLKQGLYDYRYVWVPEHGAPSMIPFEGSSFETENSYQVLVYLKRPGSRWEELAGFATTDTRNRR